MYYKKCQRLLLNFTSRANHCLSNVSLHLICNVWPHIYDRNATANSLKFYIETLNIYLHINKYIDAFSCVAGVCF